MLTPALIAEALGLARAAFAAVQAGEPTDEQLAIVKAATDAKVDAAIAEIDAALASKPD